jgi:hypothetical protein
MGFKKLLFTVTSLYWIGQFLKSVFLLFWQGIGLFVGCLIGWENAGMRKSYRFMMDYESI